MLKTIITLPGYKQHLADRRKILPSQNSLGIAAILAIFFVRFFRTIVLGKSISKLFLVSHWDPSFYALQSGQNFIIDGSLLLLHMPYRFFVAQYWRHAIPLWNDLSGFGMPLLADPQSFALSPLFALFFLFPTIYVWNQIIIIKLVIGAISTYLLCQELEFDFTTAFSAALLFAFCPWMQWQSELIGAGICFTPFVFLFFVKAAKKQSMWFAALAGIAAAINILTSHPEMAFVTITFASTLMGLVMYRQDSSKFTLRNFSSRIILVGLVAFGLSAPLLIPFKEFVANGYTYKLTEVAPANVSLIALAANYFYPFHKTGALFWGASSWLGLAGLTLLPIKRLRFALCLFICFPLSVLAITKLFPLSLLDQVPPFSYIEPIYCLPEYVVFISVLGGLGISSLLNYSNSVSSKKLAQTIFLATAPIAISALFVFWHPSDSQIRTDQASDFVQFNWKFWIINAACLIGMLAAWFLTKHQLHFFRLAGFSIFSGLFIGSLIFIAYGSLPGRPSFNYPKTLPIQIPSENSSRFLTVGPGILRHNTNLVYQLNNVQAYNPLLPAGFVEFMEACGAQTNDRFSQIFSPLISTNVDLTGTSAIISQQPLLDEAIANAHPGQGIVTYTNSLKLSDIKLFHDSKAKTIFCSLVANPDLPRHENCTLFLNLKENGSSIRALGDPQPVAGWRLNQKLVFSGLAPQNNKNWTLSAKLLSDIDGHIIRPTNTTFGKTNADGAWIVATANEASHFIEIENKRFQPISSYYNITIYKNLTALNRYFFVGKILWLKNNQAELDYLNRSGSKLRDIAIIEKSQKKSLEDILLKIQSPSVFDTSGSIKKLNVTNRIGYLTTSSALALQVVTKNPALLVLSDLYYPGWKAFLDGKEWPIFRADCLFRAVLIPAGKHQVLFEYYPVSLAIGLILFVITAVTLLLLFVGHWQRKRSPVTLKR